MLNLYEEFKSLVVKLSEQNIDYALCGGLAMAIYGVPRATVDIDLLILTESLEKVISLAKQLGYTFEAKPMTFAKGVIEIRRTSKVDPDSGDVLILDLLLVTSAITSAWESKVEVEWESGKLKVVSREGLIGLIMLKSLRSSGQDLDDIKRLKEVVDES
jgi:hypothetical protein